MLRAVKNVVNSTIGSVSRALPSWEETALVVSPSLKAHTYTFPANMEQLPAEIAAQYTHKTRTAPTVVPELHLFTVTNANVSQHGVVFSNFRLFKPDMCPYSENVFRNIFLLKQWVTPKSATKHVEEAALVHDLWSMGNYYHWLIEALPKMLMLQSYFPDISIIIPHPTPSYVKKTAAIFGFKNFIPIKAEEIIKVKRLVVPEKAPFLEMNLEDISQGRSRFSLSLVREKVIQSVSPENTIPHRNIYVSRRRQVLRQISNEEEVERILQAHGFETVFFEDLTFEEQIKLMQETAVLIGLHGAGLTNMMFLNPGAKIIEIINYKLDDHLFYYFLSSYFNLPYYSLPSVGLDAKAAINSDVVVDTNELQKVLQAAINS